MPTLVEQLAEEDERAGVPPGTVARLIAEAPQHVPPDVLGRILAADAEREPAALTARQPRAPMPPPTPRAAVQYPVGAWTAGPPEAGGEVVPPQPQPAGAGGGPDDPVPSTPDPGRGGEGGRKRLELPSFLAKGRRRRVWVILGGAIVFVILLNTCTGRAMSMLSAAAERGSMAGTEAGAKAGGGQSVTNYVVVPTDWFPCPLTDLAETAIGFSNGGKTLAADRATEVAAKVRALQALGARIPDMYIATRHNPEAIDVTPGPNPDGHALFDCSGSGSTGPPSTALVPTATSAPR